MALDERAGDLYRQAFSLAKEVQQVSPSLLGDLENGIASDYEIKASGRDKELRRIFQELGKLEEAQLGEMQDQAWQYQKERRTPEERTFQEEDMAPYRLITGVIKHRGRLPSQGNGLIGGSRRKH